MKVRRNMSAISSIAKIPALMLYWRPVVRSESVRNMIRERRMLEHLNHPFLCNLRYSFQDVEYLYASIQSTPLDIPLLTQAGTLL